MKKYSIWREMLIDLLWIAVAVVVVIGGFSILGFAIQYPYFGVALVLGHLVAGAGAFWLVLGRRAFGSWYLAKTPVFVLMVLFGYISLGVVALNLRRLRRRIGTEDGG